LLGNQLTYVVRAIAQNKTKQNGQNRKTDKKQKRTKQKNLPKTDKIEQTEFQN